MRCCAIDSPDPKYMVPLACPKTDEVLTWGSWLKASVKQTQDTGAEVVSAGTEKAAEALAKETEVGKEQAAQLVEAAQKAKALSDQGSMLIRVSDNWMMFFKAYFILNCIYLLIGFCMCCAAKKDCCASIANCVSCLNSIAMLVILIMGFVSRFSRTGQVCAGDLTEKGSDKLGEAQFGAAYYKNTGKFMRIILIV